MFFCRTSARLVIVAVNKLAVFVMSYLDNYKPAQIIQGLSCSNLQGVCFWRRNFLKLSNSGSLLEGCVKTINEISAANFHF